MSRCAPPRRTRVVTQAFAQASGVGGVIDHAGDRVIAPHVGLAVPCGLWRRAGRNERVLLM